MTEELVDEIFDELRELGPDVIAFDTVNEYLDPRGSTDKSRDVVQALQPFHRLARELNCSVIILRHLTKDHSKKAMYRGQGSISFSAKARVVVAVGLDPIDDDITRFALTKLTFVKNRFADAFYVEDQSTQEDLIKFKFKWLDPIPGLTSDQILGTQTDGGPGRPRDKRDEAKEFLLDRLDEGPMERSKIYTMAVKAKHSIATLKNAATELRIVKWQKRKGWWWWALPEHAPPYARKQRK